MNGAIALTMAVAGGFFGTSVALTMFYFIVRAVIVKAFDRMLKDAHAGGVCPVCKRSAQHDNLPAS